MQASLLVGLVAQALYMLDGVQARSARPVAAVGDHSVARITQTDEFCARFVKECYSEALHGKTGKANGKNLTDAVLAASGGTPTTSTTTTTSVAAVASTSTSTAQATGTDTLSTTITVPSYTSTTIVSTETVTSTSTLVPEAQAQVQTVVIDTFAGKKLATEAKPQTVQPLSEGRPIAGRVDKSDFCAAYVQSCERECARRRSTPRTEVCHLRGQTRDSSYTYDLACKCRNGWLETQHALQGISGGGAGGAQPISTATVVSTSTATAIAYTMQTTTVLTTSVTTTSTPAVATQTASVTRVILAPTGKVLGVNRDAVSPIGYLHPSPSQGELAGFDPIDTADPTEYMAVLDSASNAVMLQVADGSGTSILLEAGYTGGAWNTNPTGYAWVASSQSLAVNPYGPAKGVGPHAADPYESYSFHLTANTSSAAPSGALRQLDGVWVNNDRSPSPEPVFCIDSSGLFFLANDLTSLFNSYPVDPLTAVTLYLTP